MRTTTVALRRGMLVLALLWTGAAACAQQADAPAGKEPAAAKKRAEPKGRLPAHFGDVIDSQQRDKIYGIQAKYLAEVKQLQDQIAVLEKRRDEEVQSVLTPEQADKVKQLVDDARSKRAEATKKKKLAAAEVPAAEAAARP